MTDPYPQIAALVIVGAVALLMTGTQLVSIARDTNTWVILRGMTRGRIDRIRRGMKTHRG